MGWVLVKNGFTNNDHCSPTANKTWFYTQSMRYKHSNMKYNTDPKSEQNLWTNFRKNKFVQAPAPFGWSFWIFFESISILEKTKMVWLKTHLGILLAYVENIVENEFKMRWKYCLVKVYFKTNAFQNRQIWCGKMNRFKMRNCHRPLIWLVKMTKRAALTSTPS